MKFTHVITNAIQRVMYRCRIGRIWSHIQIPFASWELNNIRQFAPTCFRKTFQIWWEKKPTNDYCSENLINCKHQKKNCFAHEIYRKTWPNLRMTKYFGKRWMVKLLVLFRRVLHFEQVGISSPSNISSLMNRSKQLSNLQRLDVGSGTLHSDSYDKRNRYKMN